MLSASFLLNQVAKEIRYRVQGRGASAALGACGFGLLDLRLTGIDHGKLMQQWALAGRLHSGTRKGPLRHNVIDKSWGLEQFNRTDRRAHSSLPSVRTILYSS
jgi:hypothetical protein